MAGHCEFATWTNMWRIGVIDFRLGRQPKSSYPVNAATTLRRWRRPRFPPTSTILPQIRSQGQAILKPAECRLQNEANRTAPGDLSAAVSPVGNVKAPATRAVGCKGKASTKWKLHSMLKPAFDDYVIIINTRERISLQEAFTETAYGLDISAYLGLEQARATSVLTSRDQSIIIVQTAGINQGGRPTHRGLCNEHREETVGPIPPTHNCAAEFRTPKTAAQKGWKKKMAPKKKSHHPGLPSNQPRREPSKPTSWHHHLEVLKPTVGSVVPTGRSGETNGAAVQQGWGSGHCHRKRTSGEQLGRGCFFLPAFSLLRRVAPRKLR
ncbi:hypothetical protein HPB50_013480 [Hyalomma asiaticum]|uniref:Uncharacterized protein n=1 Tax=Hyalomma asiaticum TaxID=266040 RepID=A0ACB7RR57_HYAAI|nr:hypothetical protein HPB50_013480 [Hyalomma asiaticum]